jgi:phosphate/sulfate permease|tara:strand:- start:324 stop:794 length:471 start_codon:yes stop_codon:yes gene_type:complete
MIHKIFYNRRTVTVRANIEMKQHQNKIWGVAALTFGTVMVLIATGIVPLEEKRGDSPIVLLLFGVAMAGAGLAFVFHSYRRVNAAFSSVVIGAITGIAGWGAFLADDHFFAESPLNFFSKEANLLISRSIFGVVSFFCLILLCASLRRLWKDDSVR